MVAKALRFLGGVFGVSLIGLGLTRLLFSMAAVPGAGSVNATVDSEGRAAGPLLIAYGLAYLWAVRQSPIPSSLLRFLAAITALLALSRVVSMVDKGMPHWVFIVATAIEFVAAALTYWYATLGNQGNPAERANT